MEDELRYWIAQVCRETREAGDFRRSDVASDISREGDAIRNFETVRGGWNPQFGKIVESYAARGDTTPLALWRKLLIAGRLHKPKPPRINRAGFLHHRRNL